MDQYLISASDRFANALGAEVGYCKRIGADVFLHEGPVPHDSVFVHNAYRILAVSKANVEEIAKECAKLLDKKSFFAIECKLVNEGGSGRRGTDMGSRDIEVRVGQLLESIGFKADLLNPNAILLINIVSGSAYIGLEPGRRREKQEPRIYLNRAEKKFIEAYDFFGISNLHIDKALDVGASPGGFSKAMADIGISVTSIDPGMLHESLYKNQRIRHLRIKAEDFSSEERFDLITDDMNMHPESSARIALSLARNLASGGALLLTVKCPTRNPIKYMELAMSVLAGSFKEFRFKHLESNRSEVMMFAIKI